MVVLRVILLTTEDGTVDELAGPCGLLTGLVALPLALCRAQL